MMKKNIFAAFAAMVLLSLFAVSCAPKDDAPEEATLSLSSNAVAVPNAGGAAQAVTVTTNQATWQAIAGAEWVQTSQQGNNLVITVAPNPNNADRTTEIGVYAGAATPQKVTVTQSAADIIMEVSPEEIVVPNKGDTKLISVKNNTSNWDIVIDDTAKSWITMTKFSEFVELRIAPNEGEAREAKLYAQSGNSKPKEITVKQAGVSLSLFHKPFFGTFPPIYDIISSEAAQGSFLLGYAAANPGMPSWGVPPSGASLGFATSSKIMPEVFYQYNYDKGHLEFITYFTELKFDEFIETGYQDFLKDELGFECQLKDKTIVGSHPENGFKVIALENKGKVAVQFVGPNPPDPEQPNPQDTFDQLPLVDMMNHLFTQDRAGWKLADVEGWEASNAGTKEADQKDPEGNVKYAHFSVNAKEITIRQYWFLGSDDESLTKYPSHKLELKHIGIVVDNINYVFWQDDKGQSYLTKEFIAKMKDAGYVFEGEQAPWFWFTNGNKIMGWRKVAYQDLADGREVINGQAYIDLEAGGNRRFMLQHEKQAMMKRWAKAMK